MRDEFKETVKNLRTHGAAPYRVAVIHGGPGAAGEVAPVARELARERGVLEPIQTATTVEGQVAELRSVLEEHAGLPVTLIGHSWGAWLCFMLAAQQPALVRKLVLVSSGPFEERYVAALREARTCRLSPEERAEFDQILAALGDPAAPDKDARFARLGALCSKTDDYDPVPEAPVEGDAVEVQGELFQRVWEEATAMRRSGRLLALADRIRCPVVAIHGDYDPHPAAGVQEPLARCVQDFRFILLSQCGHKPWIERAAREEFYRVLEAEMV
jgi:pimeloyl-ACP methyl ester carboxylesterase